MWVLVLLGAASEVDLSQVRIPPGTEQVDLVPHMRFWRDREGASDVQSALERARAGLFSPLPGRPNFGFQPYAFWFYVVVVNERRDEHRWLLIQEYALSDFVDLYVPQADGSIRHARSGDRRPFTERAVRYRHPNFWVDLPPGQPVELLVRVQSGSSMQVPLILLTPTAASERIRDMQFVIGIYYGILFALFFYNLVMWLALKDQSYFWYMFHISAFGLVLFCLNGLAFEYVWPHAVWVQDKSVPVAIALAQIGMQQFARIFLQMPTRWRFGNGVAKGFIGFFILLLVASLFLPYRISVPIGSAAVLPSVGWILVASVIVWRRGDPPAGLFLLAWFLLLCGTAVFTLVAFGVLPKITLTEYGVQVGSALEMILLSLALSYRYASLRDANERIMREASERLEERVAERTQQLDAALKLLADANEKLQEFSRLDGLTSLYNRRHFEERIFRDVQERLVNGGDLSLLVIDIDHFKKINDTHGHLIGDECLRHVAKMLKATASEAAGWVARYGGEEFVMVLPMTAAEAVAEAERLRDTIAHSPVRSPAGAIVLSLSIGVAQMLPATEPAAVVRDVLQRADEALYRAKRLGRNRVMCAEQNP